jgi:2-phosphoglycerate kinase
MEEVEITVVNGGRETPFSRGILAQTLTQAGARPELAYRIASELRAELAAEERYTVAEEEVLARVRAKLQTMDASILSRLDRWQLLRESTEPVVVLIGGATGVGTSTLAADVARRLNIQSVIGTDSIREVLRRAVSPELLPILHKSSYGVKKEDIRVPIEDSERVLYGFRAQASQVSVGVEAIVDRGLEEGTNLVVEGVHLAPELLMEQYKDHPNVCPLIVYLSDCGVHRDRFYVRALGTSMRRPAEEYISHFGDIRQIHDYLLETARGRGVRAVENISIDAASDAAVEIVTKRVSNIAEGATRRSTSLLLDTGPCGAPDPLYD